jgi:peptidoglycan/xylan/chitin deacetylase (PgdA/CDA1 family)
MRAIAGFVGIGAFAVLFAYVGIPYLYGKWARMLLERRVRKHRVLVLTFDDGPGDRLTLGILKVLAEHNVKATFFLLGRNIQGRTEIVRQIAAEGHEICSHGYDHINYWYTSPLRALTDIKRGWQAIDAALGVENRKYPFRPPYGKLNILCLLYLIFRRIPVVYWSIVSGDTWLPERINSQRVGMLARKKGGGVVLVHDFDRSDSSVDSTVLELVRTVLTTAQQAGLRVRTVSELLNM